MKRANLLLTVGWLLVTGGWLWDFTRPVDAEDAPKGTKEVTLDGLMLKVPPAWVQQAPSSNLRLGQFLIPAAAGDPEAAELGIFSFGAGGGIQENVDRWIGQFETAARKVKSSKGKSPQGDYVLVDVTGTYKKPIGPPIQQKTQLAPGYRMIGVILSVEKKGNYFLKLTGPEKTVADAATAFRTSLGAVEQDEKPYPPAQP